MLIIDINPDGTVHETVVADPEPQPADTTALAEALANLPADTLAMLKEALGI